jgi:hypothetical protein
VEEGGGYLIFDIALASIWRMRSLQSTTTTTTITRRIKKKKDEFNGSKGKVPTKSNKQKEKEAKP